MQASLPDIGFKQLNAIVSLARFGSFIAAASYLGISQPGLTRIVQQAEKKLGAKLFIRSQRRVALTPAGEEFLPFAEHMVGELIKQAELIQTKQGLPETKLNIACLMSISNVVLPRALVEFRKAYPQIDFEVREGLGTFVNEEVRKGSVDFAIGNADDHPPNVVMESVMEETLCVVFCRGHPLATKKVLRLSDLKELSIISMPTDSGLRRLIENSALKQGFKLNNNVVTNQYSSLFSFVDNELGVAIVPTSALPSNHDDYLVSRLLAPTITRRICVMHLAERPLDATSEAFLRTLRPLLAEAVIGPH